MIWSASSLVVIDTWYSPWEEFMLFSKIHLSILRIYIAATYAEMKIFSFLNIPYQKITRLCIIKKSNRQKMNNKKGGDGNKEKAQKPSSFFIIHYFAYLSL